MSAVLPTPDPAQFDPVTEQPITTGPPGRLGLRVTITGKFSGAAVEEGVTDIK
jgi:hypothetical protein